MTLDPHGWNRPTKTAKDTAIFLGCSYTVGVGIEQAELCYPSVVADHFGRELLNLAQPGGSNSNIFDLFTQIDFHEGQIVVVQLTELCRLYYCDESKVLTHLRLSTLNKNTLNQYMLEIFNKDFLFHELVTKVRAMVTIARSKKLKLVFWLMHYNMDDLYSALDQQYFEVMPEFIPSTAMGNYLVDGAPKSPAHPGPESHKNIAQAVITHIEQLYGKS